jgi:hypothetical protein
MKNSREKRLIQELLEPAGIQIGGSETFDIHVHSPDFYSEVLARGLFVMEDWHSFGHYYDRTLMTRYKKFTDNWDQLKNAYDETFYHMWSYYLLSCAGAFRSKRNHLWQIVFSKKEREGGYEAIR